MEQPGPAGQHAFVFGARCGGLAAWGTALGFGVIHIGVAANPLSAIRSLGIAQHGRGGMALDDISPDPLAAWDDWDFVPISGCLAPSVAIESWGGALRVRLLPGSTAAQFRRRLAALLSPLDAVRAALSPTAARLRSDAGAMPPPMPRFTLGDEGWATAEGLYKWAAPEDADYASRAVAEALESLVLAQSGLDLLSEGEAALARPAGSG